MVERLRIRGSSWLRLAESRWANIHWYIHDIGIYETKKAFEQDVCVCVRVTMYVVPVSRAYAMQLQFRQLLNTVVDLYIEY